MSYRFTKLNAQHITQIKLQKPEELDVYRSEISEHIFSLLQDALQLVPVTSLDIGATNLDDGSLRELFEQFSIRQLAPRNLRILSLSKLNLRGSVKQLANYVQEYHCQLEELDVHDCQLGNPGLTTLIPAFQAHFQHSASLKQVNLRKNLIQTVVAVNLRKMIEESQVFCNFDLQLNEINESVLEWFEQPRKAGVERVAQRVRNIVIGSRSDAEDPISKEFEQFKQTFRAQYEEPALSEPSQTQQSFRADRFYEQEDRQFAGVLPATSTVTQRWQTSFAEAEATPMRTSELDQYYLKTRELTNLEIPRVQIKRIPVYKPTEPTFFKEEEEVENIEEMSPLLVHPIQKQSIEPQLAVEEDEPIVPHHTAAEELILDDVRNADSMIAKTTPINFKKNIFKATARNLQQDSVNTQFIQRSQGVRMESHTTSTYEKRMDVKSEQKSQIEQKTQSTEKESGELARPMSPRPALAVANSPAQNTQLSFSEIQEASFSPGQSEAHGGVAATLDLCELLNELEGVPELYFKLKPGRQLSYIKQRLHEMGEEHDELVEGAEGAEIILETYNQIYEQLIRQGLLFGEVKHPTGICAIQDYISTIGVETYKLILNLIKQQTEYDLDGQNE